MSRHLLAVTIGIGPEHELLAQHAAERMRRFTGLEVQILGPVEYAASACRHPCHLKFRLFDLVDAENILYFDADAFCLRPWNPRPLCDRQEWIGVRGLWFDPWVERLGRAYGFGQDIFSGGVFLCNRAHHLRVLRLAEIFQRDDDMFQGGWNPDEVALNTALKALGVDVHFLDRRYNWLQYGRGTLEAQAGVVIAHACSSELRSRYLKGYLPESSIEATSAADALPYDIAGKTFIYDRIGYDARPVEFRLDGTIGLGGGDAERYYFSEVQGGRRRLILGGLSHETCKLEEHKDGTWQGRWTAYERMPVKLQKHRAQVLIDLIRDRGLDTAGKTFRGAEIGVYAGETSALLLAGLPNLQLCMVDPWREAAVCTDYRRTGDPCAALPQDRFDEAMYRAAVATEFAAERRTILPCEQARAADFVPGEFDMAFIDGDHSYSGTYSAIANWWAKLCSGGLMAGHDYKYPEFPGVKQAVDEFASQHGLRVRCGPDTVWWYERSGSS
jgi:methyltransferase family protein